MHARKGVAGAEDVEVAALLSAAVAEAAPDASPPAQPPVPVTPSQVTAGAPGTAGPPGTAVHRDLRAHRGPRAQRADRRPDMATVTFLVHPERPDALALADDTASWLHTLGHRARILRFSGPDRVG